MRIFKPRPDLAGVQADLHRWFDSDAGRGLLAAECDLLRPLLSDSFGYHLLQLSIDQRHCLYQDSRVCRKLRAGPALGAPELAARCEYHALPFASDSQDVVIVHHVLEFSANPHIVLREIQRVTLPGGRVFVLGFNPWSLQGLRALRGRLRGRGPWQNSWLPAHRVADWMQLLGFETEPAAYMLQRPSLALPAGLRAGVADMARAARMRADRRDSSAECATGPQGRLGWQRHWPVGAVWLISAVKQVAPLTPMKPRWAPANGLGLSLIQPGIGRQAARTGAPKAANPVPEPLPGSREYQR